MRTGADGSPAPRPRSALRWRPGRASQRGRPCASRGDAGSGRRRHETSRRPACRRRRSLPVHRGLGPAVSPRPRRRRAESLGATKASSAQRVDPALAGSCNSSGVIVPGTAQRLLHTLPGGDRRVRHEAQCRSALQSHLAGDGRLQLRSVSLESGQGSFGQRRHEDSGVTQVRFHAHRADREQRQPGRRRRASARGRRPAPARARHSPARHVGRRPSNGGRAV